MKRCMWRGVLSCYACCMSLSLPPSSAFFLLCLHLASPSFTPLFYGKKESEVWQVNAVKACDKLCICVSPPSLKRRKSHVEIDSCWSALPSRRIRREGSSEVTGKWRMLEGEGSDFLRVLSSGA